jgi:sarcosine oxidase subunit alpha
MNRLPPQPDEVIDRSRPVGFTWNGRPVKGYEGDVIVSALLAAGHAVVSRSFKHHRPRGPMTASFLDPNTMVQVDDEPNVRAGHRRIRGGMAVSAQNVWPSLEVDARAANGLIGRFLAPGFYYKTFMKPAPLWPLYSKVLRRFASGGTVSEEIPKDRYDARFAHPDVLVAGGGPAGMAAALAAADEGASVMLVDEEPQLGGYLRYTTGCTEVRADLVRRVEAHPGIEILTDSVVTGRYEHNWVAVMQRSHPGTTERLIKARAKSLVVAAGKVERPYVFEGNDLPGVMLSTGVQRLINLYGVRPGSRAVVLTANETGDAVAQDLQRAGVELAAVVDAREGHDIVRATGSKRLRQVDLSDGRTVDADLLVTAVGWTTPTSLLNMAGVKPNYRPEAGRFIPDSLPHDVLATGGVGGDGSIDELIAHGTAIGRIAARRGLAVKSSWRAAIPSIEHVDVIDRGAEVPPELQPEPHLELYRAATHGFVDFSEDVKSKDLISAAREGYDSMELSKRYTTATMGPIQGKLEVGNAVAVHADAIGASIAEVGTTTWRPPYAPVSLGALAAATHHVERVTPMQSWQDVHGGVRMRAGAWWRTDHYGDPPAEVTNVRTNVGIIDVSPLGKIDLRGSDVTRLLEFVYTNRWSKLGMGKVRYGVMANEDGVVMDDGVTARLGEDHYYMTTTSGGAGRIWNWLDDWLQTSFPDWDIRMTAVTDGYAGINVAGPRSRELLARLTDIDVSANTFPYMSVKVGTVAGVAGCRIMRIGFTGELSYEVHVPAGFGLYLWETLMEVGADLGIRPFGVEAQRILRLEKGHFIVGQDTDGLTQGFGLGIDGLMKLDKPDFAGKPELVWQQQRNDHKRLVAIQPVDPDVVPHEACQLIDGSDTGGWEIVGRITSSRYSPTLGRSIGLAHVVPGYAVPGTEIVVRLTDGSDSVVRVMEHHAHFDPKGARLRG